MNYELLAVTQFILLLLSILYGLSSTQLIEETGSSGLKYLFLSVFVVAIWSISEFILVGMGLKSKMIVIFSLVFSSFISISGFEIVGSLNPIPKFNFLNSSYLRLFIFSTLLPIFVFFIGFSEPINSYYNLILLISILLLAIGLGAFSKIVIYSSKLSWNIIGLGLFSLLISLLQLFYVTNVCRLTIHSCLNFPYSFRPLLELPYNQVILNISSISPYLLDFSLIIFGVGLMLLHRDIRIKSESISADSNVNSQEEFLINAMKVLGNLYGEDIAKSMITQIMVDNGVDVRWERGVNIEDNAMDTSELEETLMQNLKGALDNSTQEKIRDLN